jgi:hypothetical protein
VRGAPLLGCDERVVLTVQNEQRRPAAGELAERAEHREIPLSDALEGQASSPREPDEVADAALEHDPGDECRC